LIVVIFFDVPQSGSDRTGAATATRGAVAERLYDGTCEQFMQ